VNDNCLYTEAAAYHQLDTVMGETITMSCNTTSSSGADWTRNTTFDGYGYVYVNGTIRSIHGIQYSIVDPSTGDYSLSIYNVHPADSGLYDCYETDGTRIIGYYLVAKGMFLNTLERIARLFTYSGRVKHLFHQCGSGLVKHLR